MPVPVLVVGIPQLLILKMLNVKIDYSVHNNESWGGFVHAQRNAPDEFWGLVSSIIRFRLMIANSSPPDGNR